MADDPRKQRIRRATRRGRQKTAPKSGNPDKLAVSGEVRNQGSGLQRAGVRPLQIDAETLERERIAWRALDAFSASSARSSLPARSADYITRTRPPHGSDSGSAPIAAAPDPDGGLESDPADIDVADLDAADLDTSDLAAEQATTDVGVDPPPEGEDEDERDWDSSPTMRDATSGS